LAHYLCEQAATLLAQGDESSARALLEQAIASAPQVPRPRMDLAALWTRSGQAAKACKTLTEALYAAPSAIPLIAPLLAQSALAAGEGEATLALLKSTYLDVPSLDVLDAIVTLEASSSELTPTARDWYARHLEKEPSLVAATKWIAGEKLEREAFHPQVQRAPDHAVKPLTRYRCAACGFEAKVHFWQCPGCQAWDSYPARRVEEL